MVFNLNILLYFLQERAKFEMKQVTFPQLYNKVSIKQKNTKP